MSKKRSKTYFGVVIPAFKEENYGAHSTTIRFVIKGSIISKKNNEMAVIRKKEAREFLNDCLRPDGTVKFDDAWKAIDKVQAKIAGNYQYRSFLEQQKPILEQQKATWLERLSGKGLSFPLKFKATMSLQIYFKSEYIQDTVNKQQTIQDLLVDCGILIDDDHATLNPIKASSSFYKNAIVDNIAFISLTFLINENNENAKIKNRILSKLDKENSKNTT